MSKDIDLTFSKNASFSFLVIIFNSTKEFKNSTDINAILAIFAKGSVPKFLHIL
jgi:hypothetical protein